VLHTAQPGVQSVDSTLRTMSCRFHLPSYEDASVRVGRF
jgi:hypothetical protein